MTDSIAVLAPAQFVPDANGNPVSGAKLKFFLAGGDTPLTVYSDSSLATALGTEVACNSSGIPVTAGNAQTLVYTGTDAYKLRITDASDVTVWEVDNIKGAPNLSAISGGGSGTWSTSVTSNTTDFTLSTSDDAGELKNCDPSGGNFTATLPSAVTAGDGFRVGFRHAGTANQVLIATVSGQSIELPGGSTTNGFALTGLGHTAWLVSDGAGWTVDLETKPLGDGVIVIADRLTAPPSSPTPGARYLLNGTPTGDWASFSEHDIVEADGQGGWIDYTPGTDAGWLAYIQDENLLAQFRDSAWVDLDNITAPTTSDLKHAVYRHTDASGTNGGTSTAGSWVARELNTEDFDTIGITTSGSPVDTLTLPVGTYWVWGSQYHANGGGTQVRFTNSGATNLVAGENSQASNNSVHLAGLLEVTTEETYQFQYHRATASNSGDLGAAKSNGTETYAILKILDLSSVQGPTGSQGPQGNAGADGADAGFSFTWNTDTGATDPTTGQVKGNNASLASITALYISETDGDSTDLSSEVATWVSGTKVKIQGSAGMVLFQTNAAPTDNGSWVTLSGSVLASRGSLSGTVAVLPSLKGTDGTNGTNGTNGSDGADGTDPGVRWQFDGASQTMAEPSTGFFRLNNATVASATAAAFDAATAESGNPDGSDILAALSSITNATTIGRLRMIKSGEPETFAEFDITSVTDNTAWLQLALTHRSSNGTITTNDYFSVQIGPAGNDGADGAGSGDVTAASAFGTDNRLIRSDGTGKGVQASGITIDDSDNITGVGTVDGRDLATDGTKLDGIEGSADVTDATNVAAAGAIMDGDFSSNGLMKRDGAGSYSTAASGTDYAPATSGSAILKGDGSGGFADAVAGTDYEAANADILKADEYDTLTQGYDTTADDDGTQSSGTYTPTADGGNIKSIINGGAFTLDPPTNEGTIIVEMTNNGSAGTVTTSGFTVVKGDSLTTTNGDDFHLVIVKSENFSSLTVIALQ